jgi:ferredoxin
MVGEFEKPKYFNYKASICAHSRSQKAGCNRCLDVCSTAAISADGDHVKVEPHLCMGCGACATECPSGAMTYAYPSAPDLARRLRTLLQTYERAGGRDAVVLLHAADGRDVIANAARRGDGLPARVIPVEVHHIASVGLDLWLAALAWGASQVAVLATGAEAPEYHAALTHQMGVADAIAQGLGYQGEHFRLLDGADAIAFAAALRDWPAALAVRVAATFAGTPEKRTTAALAIEHLALHAPVPRKEIALPAGAPFGTIAVNADTCTMCLACVGSCPVGALQDGQEVLELRFVESKCVQCGLCRETCPESAITLAPRLSLAAEARAPRVVNAATIFKCIQCGKPMGTDKMIGNMLAKLAGHSMFAQPGALDRLKMCADCRVVDLIRNETGPGSGDTGGAR